MLRNSVLLMLGIVLAISCRPVMDTTLPGETGLQTAPNLPVSLSEQEIQALINRGYVRYSDFGAASFIIDDTDLENIRAQVFEVTSSLEPFALEGITSLKRNQPNIGVTLPGPALVQVRDDSVRRFIRFGLNQNLGSPQTDIFIVDADGNVDAGGPIIWDFDRISDVLALPIDEVTLRVTGGHFTTIANQAESRYTYHNRGLGIMRSNVVVDGLQHHVVGEGDHGAPYTGFINIGQAANVTVSNVLLTGRKTYQTIVSAGLPVSMGSYDISVNRSINVTFVNCRQTNAKNAASMGSSLGYQCIPARLRPV